MTHPHPPERQRALVDLLEATKLARESSQLELPGSEESVRRLARRAQLVAKEHGSATLAQQVQACLFSTDRAALLEAASGIERGLRDVLLGERGHLPALLVGISAREVQAIQARIGPEAPLQHAATATEARRLAGEASMILIDLVLDDADGRDLLLDWAQDPTMAGVPIVAVVPASGGRLRPECLALGATEVLERPFEPEELARVIVAMLGHQHGATQGRAGFRPIAKRAAEMGRVWTVVVLKVVGPDTRTDTIDRAGSAMLSHGLPAGAGWVRWADDGYAVLLPGVGADDAEALVQSMVTVAELRGLRVMAGAAVASGQRPEEVARVAHRMLELALASGDSVVVTELEPALARRVLVVEDDDMMARLLIAILERMGLGVTRARDGREGLEVARRERFDLVLLDVDMPHMTGIELLSELRASDAYRAIPIAMCTSLGGKRDVDAAMSAGADDYVVKPFGRDLLETRVRALLAQPTNVRTHA